MMAGGKAPGHFPAAWRLLGAGVCGVLLAYAVGVLAALDVQAFPEARRAELMSGWVGMAACIHAVAMAFAWRAASACGGQRERKTEAGSLPLRFAAFLLHFSRSGGFGAGDGCGRCSACSASGYHGGQEARS